jgi:hypothetical protein
MAVNIPVEKINDFLGSRMQRAQDEERTAKLRERLGNDDEAWGGPEFSNGLDTSTAQARAATQKMRDHLAAAGADPDRPMVFNVSIAGRTVRIEVRQDEDGQFSCLLPVEVAPSHWEWRTLLANSYDGLIGSINRVLSARPSIRELSEQERLELGLLAAQDKEEAFWRYIELRTGKERDESLLRDPRYVNVRNDAVLFIYSQDPKFPNTPQAIAHIRNYANGRPLTLPLCRAAMKTYEEPKEEKPPVVTEADINSASDKEINESLRGLARARAEQDRKKRELVYGKQ